MLTLRRGALTRRLNSSRLLCALLVAGFDVLKIGHGGDSADGHAGRNSSFASSLDEDLGHAIREAAAVGQVLLDAPIGVGAHHIFRSGFRRRHISNHSTRGGQIRMVRCDRLGY